MKESDVKAEKIKGNGMRTQIIIIIPEKINESWEYSHVSKGYVKTCYNMDEVNSAKKEISEFITSNEE